MDHIVRSSRDLGSAIQLARTRQKLRQVDLAHKARVRQALISEIENGVVAPNLHTITRILAVLDLDLTVVPRRQAEFDPTLY